MNDELDNPQPGHPSQRANLIDIIEQAIFETGTELEAPTLAAQRILEYYALEERLS